MSVTGVQTCALPICLLLLGEFVSFCSRAFRCVVKLLVCALSNFFLEALRAMIFPLRTAFIVSHKFGYVLASFSLNSKTSLILSLFLPWPSYHLEECCSSSTCMWDFSYLCCYWRSAFVHGDVIGCMGYFQYFCWVLFYDWLWSIVEKGPWGAKRKL